MEEVSDEEDPCMEELLVATFDREEPRDALWRYADYIINIGATSNGIVIGIDDILCSIDEFCEAQNITEIAPLYRFLLPFCQYCNYTGAKYISNHKDDWLKRFPNGVTYKTKPSHSTLQSYQEYLENRDLQYQLKLLKFYLQSAS